MLFIHYVNWNQLGNGLVSLLYRKDRRRRSFELKMPAGRRATQIDDLGIKKDKNRPHQILHQDRHHLENNPYPEVLLRSCGECPWKSFLLVDFRCIFAQFLDIWFHGVFLL